MESKKRTTQVFTIAFCLVLSLLAFFFNSQTQKRTKEEQYRSKIIYKNAGQVEGVLPDAAYKALAKSTEEYFKGIGYAGDEFVTMRVLDSSVEERGEEVVFRCFYEESKTNTLVVIYDTDKKTFDFLIEEQKE